MTFNFIKNVMRHQFVSYLWKVTPIWAQERNHALAYRTVITLEDDSGGVMS